MHVLLENETVVIGFASGEIVKTMAVTPYFEVVGVVDSGISAMEWSPEQELLIVATNHGSIMSMTTDFDLLTEIPLYTDEFGAGTFISSHTIYSVYRSTCYSGLGKERDSIPRIFGEASRSN
jgi:hypothetical protein